MRLGRLDRRITVQRRGAPSRNDMNEPVETWSDVGTFWAEQVQQRPTEAWKAGQTAAQVETVFRVRWLERTASITPLDRLICEGRDYRIVGVTEPVRRAVIEIVAVAYSEEGLNA